MYTTNVNPISQAMRKITLRFEADEEKHHKTMLDNGIIQPSTFSWASPPVLIVYGLTKAKLGHG
jgi:hypothetical protein